MSNILKVISIAAGDLPAGSKFFMQEDCTVAYVIVSRIDLLRIEYKILGSTVSWNDLSPTQTVYQLKS